MLVIAFSTHFFCLVIAQKKAAKQLEYFLSFLNIMHE